MPGRRVRRIQTTIPNRPPEVRKPAGDKPRLVTSYDMPKEEEKEERPLRAPTFGADVLGVSVLVFLFSFLFTYALSRDALTGAGWAGFLAGLAVIWRASTVLDQPVSYYRHTWWQKVNGEEVEVEKDPNLVVIPAGGGATVEFYQPRPGEFASWIRQVLDDVNKQQPPQHRVTLSQNTAVSRGWSIAQYRSMLNALDDAGWIIEDGQYIMPGVMGEEYIARWLRVQQRRSER